MRICEFGKNDRECVLLIHPSLVTWDYFEYVIPLLEKRYHLLIPALPGYDPEDDSQFCSVEQTASRLADDILQKGIREVKAIYGCSMGGSVALRMAVDGKLRSRHYIMDGGITPYQLPWILTRFIALRDFGMMALGKLGGEKIIVKAFSSTQYSEEDLRYVADMFRHCTYRTLWNSFDSCNNYQMPKEIMRFSGKVHYWYAESERSKKREYPMDWVFDFSYDLSVPEYYVTHRECGVCKIGRQEGLTFLTPHMCVMDYPTIEYKGGKLLRTKTLGAGGDCCDFHVVRPDRWVRPAEALAAAADTKRKKERAMIKTTMKIDGMMCGMCEAHICDAIRKAVPEARKVTASRGKKEASFLIEGAVDADSLKAAIDATGYSCLGVESAPYEKKGLFGRR